MKKLTLLLLLMISTNVFAEWTEVSGNDALGLTAYIDFGTIKRKGNKVKMWTMYDFKTVQKVDNYRYLSLMTRFEYDCEEDAVRQLDIHIYSGNMKQGKTVDSVTNIKNEATSVRPDTIEETLFKIACGKK